ncbi:CBF/Mak21 family domain-containing protein [Trichoderma breve]|uniref:CBF/Mak21 family domain-containing protein n=1 Tax=Trichoderma breve TaxID=2034170 RepID=A0A9W9BGW4_9HYPO|nr:CBF/Mak21 family domain-containing protein [Trichoderma breve]KAJ4861144.1 CBF/Mak21 family domain-containing protein [Trichoderma breve]
MPAGSKDSAKRKRTSTGDKVTKVTKRRRSSNEEAEDPNAKILLMEQGILESKKNYNDIATLLSIASRYEDGEDESTLAAVTLCRIFLRLLAQGSLIAKKGLSEKDSVVVGWLKDQFSQYKTLLQNMLGDEDLAVTALTLCMRTLKAEGEHLYDKEEYTFPQAFLESIIAVLITSDNEDARKAFLESYVEEYDDIRYYTFKSVKSILNRLDKNDIPDNLFDQVYALLSALDGVPQSAEELEDFYIPRPKKKSHDLRSAIQHKRQGQDAWLAILSIVQTKDERKRILSVISTNIAPWFTKPELLSDFLTSCYNTGGSMSLLALSGVFYLIQERNLDYPSFYTKLYSLLDKDILHSKHRSRFFRLLDTFLGSTHLPAALVASFIKRLSRLSLNAPPSAIATVVPWAYNLLRRHPTCTFMIHRDVQDPELKKHIQNNGAEDPFNATETDPMDTGAIDSCLWEIVQLQSHYHPNVATIAKILSEQFTKQSYNMEDFLDHSYASLLDAEMAKDIKKAPVVEFQIPKRVFLPQDEPATNPDSLLVKLWDFGEPAKGVAAA